MSNTNTPHHHLPRLFTNSIALAVILVSALGTVACSAPNQVSEPTTIPIPTVEATETVPPTPTPTSTPAPTATPEIEILELPPGNCAHPFYPVIEGRTLVYENDDLTPNQYSVSFVDVNTGAFAMQLNRGQDIDLLIPWTCTPDGLLSPEFLESYTGIEEIPPEMATAEGLTLLDSSRMVLGSEWSTEYTIRAMGRVETMAGPPLYDIDVVLEHQIAAKEPISVEAGDYSESYRVDTVGTYSFVISLDGEVIRADVRDLSYSSWFVENVGLVRQEFRQGWSTEQGDGTSVSELISIE